jgi:glycosyltransferase involved in cell wall biosynthesis
MSTSRPSTRFAESSGILPAKSESGGLRQLIPAILEQLADWSAFVVDDGSTDDTAALARSLGARVISHPYSKGNGAAIKTGARTATRRTLVFMDADGQHQPADIPRLLARLDTGYDMVVGARGASSQAGSHRAAANGLYNILASWMVEHRVEDLTSGFRAVHADKFREFLYLLPNGFSYPTTITMCFFRAGYSVCYETIHAPKRIGKSHIRLMRDGIRFFLIIFKIGTLYSPLKIFAPISVFFFIVASSYYGYTFLAGHRFTNMSALLYINAIVIFLIGLVSEQITALTFKDNR